jgi:hypothetical protein
MRLEDPGSTERPFCGLKERTLILFNPNLHPPLSRLTQCVLVNGLAGLAYSDLRKHDLRQQNE